MLNRSLVALAIGFMVLLVGGGSRFAIGLTLKPMAEDLGWTRSTLGLAAAAFLVVSASCMFLSGRLVDRLSLRLVLGGGLVLSALGIGLISVINAPWQAVVLYGGVFAIGSGLASMTPIGVMVTRFFPERVGLANASAISGMGVGQLIIIAGLASVLADIGWRSVYAWLGVINFLLLPLLLIGITQQKTAAKQQALYSGPSLSLREAARTRHFRFLIAVYAICGVQDFFVATHVVAFAQDNGISTLRAGHLLALMGFTGLLGVILAGWWSDRASPLRPTIFCFVLRVGIFSLILLDQDIPKHRDFCVVIRHYVLDDCPTYRHLRETRVWQRPPWCFERRYCHGASHLRRIRRLRRRLVVRLAGQLSDGLRGDVGVIDTGFIVDLRFKTIT